MFADARRTRKSSIELLRIIASLGVVILHYNSADIGGAFKYVNPGSINEIYLYFTENAFACAVDIFVLISGYYLSTNNIRRIYKIIELCLQVILFNWLFYLISIFDGSAELSLRSCIGNFLPINYFVILYSVLYILSPYANILIENISKKQFKTFLFLLFLLFSVWTIFVDITESITGLQLGGLSTVGVEGDQSGYTIVNFMLLYFIGAYIRKSEKRVSKKIAMLGMIITFSANVSLSLCGYFLKKSIVVWNYNNPLLIALSVFVILFFMNFEMQSRIINELSRGSFTCFLLHGQILSKWIETEDIVNMKLPVLVAHQILVSVSIYLISYVIYKLFSVLFAWLSKVLGSLCTRIDNRMWNSAEK